MSIPILALGLLTAADRCEPENAAQAAIDEMYEKSFLMGYSERIAFQRKTLENLQRRYPGDLFVERRYIALFKEDLTGELPTLQKRYVERARQHPKDPAALYAAAVSLHRYDTPETIRLLENAKQLDPTFGWAYSALADIHSRGKFADKPKAAEEVAGYYRACPDRMGPLGLLASNGSTETQRARAKYMRERLANETDPKKLMRFSNAWGMEFRMHPMAEHPALRKQVAADLKWLETRNPKPDVNWLEFLRSGYKQSNAPKEVIAAIEDRVVKEFPDGPAALAIVRDRWSKAHPEPKQDDPPAIWDRYLREQLTAVEGWIPQFPHAAVLKRLRASTLAQLRPLPVEQAIAAQEDSLKAGETRSGPDPSERMETAHFYVRNGLRPERALELARSAEPLFQQEWRSQLAHDDSNEKQMEELRAYQTSLELDVRTVMLSCYRALNRVQDARALRAKLEEAVPKDPSQASIHWQNLALLAGTEGRKTDALVYYETALAARPKPPGKQYGRVEDQLLDEVHRTFLASGGTEAAWAVWNSKPTVRSASGIDAHWERPAKALPPFELADLRGKPWTLKTLEGKTVLITVWASW